MSEHTAPSLSLSHSPCPSQHPTWSLNHLQNFWDRYVVEHPGQFGLDDVI